MASILYKNEKLAKLVSRFVDSARAIAANQLAIGRCGSMFMDVTSCMPPEAADRAAISPEYEIGEELKGLKGKFLYATAAKCSLEYFARVPMELSSIIRISPSCKSYEVIADNLVKFSDDLEIALRFFGDCQSSPDHSMSLFHAYPSELEVAMRKLGNSSEKFLQLALELSPDQAWTFKKGFVTIENDGSQEFVRQISSALSAKNNVFVPRHGLYTFGIDPLAASDKIFAINYIATMINRIEK